MMYGRAKRTLWRWRVSGAKACADGLGMLVEQSSRNLFVWRGMRPETESVLNNLRRQLNA